MTHVIADDTGPAPTEAPRFDGFDLAYVTTPGSFADFVDLVVPELGSRGRIAAPSGGATLRERLHGAAGSSRIRDDHPAARHRELAIRKRESAGTQQLSWFSYRIIRPALRARTDARCASYSWRSHSDDLRFGPQIGGALGHRPDRHFVLAQRNRHTLVARSSDARADVHRSGCTLVEYTFGGRRVIEE